MNFKSDLGHQNAQAVRAGMLLRHAADAVESERADESDADRAQRYRGAAVLAHSAALELAVTCGWFEAARVVEGKS